MTPRRIVVQGDVTMDWNLASTPRAEIEGEVPTGFDSVVARCQPGGAALLWELIDRIAHDLGDNGSPVAEVLPPGGPFDAVFPGDRRYHHSYAIWSRRPIESGRHRGEPAWRVESCLGVDPRETAPPVEVVADNDDRAGGPSGGTDPEHADVLVLDDANFGFRDDEPLPACIRAPAADDYPWVLLKMARPIAAGRLWRRLLQRPDRLVVIVPIGDLRASDAQVSRGLSWERTAQDLVRELTYNPSLSVLGRCAYVVVSFDTSGAVVVRPSSKATASFDARVFFDPETLEGDWGRRRPGSMVGYTTCLVGGIARQLMCAPDDPDLDLGVQRGLAALRVLHERGYRSEEGTSGGDGGAATRRVLYFPTARIAEELAGSATPFVVTPVRHPVTSDRDEAPELSREGWSILRDRYEGQNFNLVAARIVRFGAGAVLSDVPRGEFGDLLTVDRDEIEGFRSISSLVVEYDSSGRPSSPLNLAVFGPPGSGKSWSIVQVVKSALPDKIDKLTFNLSQLADPSELLDAFHQVRDRVLAGKLPLVFWDEFDTSLNGDKLGWLRYFLAPMQDGEFQHGPLTHSIGPAIFVFAGGTAERMSKFTWEDPDFGMEKKDFIARKAPDFISRLKGHVDILGPNRRTDGRPDPYFRLRRAILLRSVLLRDERHLSHHEAADGKTREVLSMDPGVVRAFIQTREYRHGARSLQSIVAMSELSRASSYERSALPASDQLAIHVDADDFLGLVRQLELTDPALVERLAEWVHVIYCDQMLSDRTKNYEWGADDDVYLREHPPLDKYVGTVPLRGRGDAAVDTLAPWSDLRPDYREESRASVRDIPNKLAAANYAITQVAGTEPPVDEELEAGVIELLAELEHDRWMVSKLESGWRWAAARDPDRYENDALLAWTKMSRDEMVARYGNEFADRIGDDVLSDQQKEKDRALARGIPAILREEGYTIVKIEDG